MTTTLFANNAGSTLAGGITNASLTANLASGTGALFPHPAADEYFVGTFTDASTGLLTEIVHITDVTGDVITMVRAQEGTTALNWAANDLFDNLMTAGTWDNFVQDGQQTGFVNVAVYTKIAGVQNVSINGAAFTTTGATTFAEPESGVAEFEGMGGGGGGGGSPATGGATSAAAGGGGGGARGKVLCTALSGATAIVIGAAGTSGSNAAGGNGGATNAGAFLVCPGGTGAVASAAAAAPFIQGGGNGAATATSSGPIANVVPLYLSGGDGGDYGIAVTNANVAGGAGGDCSPFGTGGQATAAGAGAVGTGYGGGGSGASAGISAGALAGGTGLPGAVIVRW